VTDQAREPASEHHQAREPVGDHPWRIADWFGVAVFGAAGLCAGIWLMSLGRGLTFFYDEWDFVEEGATTGYWHNVLQPHNGHPSMVPFSLYEALLHTVGLRHYWPYQLVLVLLDIGCGWLLFILLRRKVHPLVAAAASAALMLLGPAWQDLLWPFQFGFLGSVAGGLGALTLLERDTGRADLGACACLLVSVACSGVGLPFLVGVAVELAWRRRSWARLWVPALPIGLFVIWYETVGKSRSSTISPVTVVHSVASDTSTTLGALVGSGTTAGALVSAVFAALIIVAVVRSPGQAARLAMGVTGLLAFWLLTLLARGVSQNSASRYLYPTAVLVLIAAGELPTLITRNRRVRHTLATPTWVTMAGTLAASGVVAFAAVAIWWNAGELTKARGALAAVSSKVRAELGAVMLAGPALPATFHPDLSLMPQVSVGPYHRAVQAFGSPADSYRDILGKSEPMRASLDEMLLRGRPMEVLSTPGLDGLVTADDHCLRSLLGPETASSTFDLPQLGALVTAPQDVGLALRVKSFSSSFPNQSFETIPKGRTILVKWPLGPAALQWNVKLTAVPAPIPAGSVATVCQVTSGVTSRNPTTRA
jgi:hypothetical protein